MCGAFDTNVCEISCMASTRRIERHQLRCAHGPLVKCTSRCTPSSRCRQCSADGSKLHAGSERAAPKTRPKIGPKSVPPDGSTDSATHSRGTRRRARVALLIQWCRWQYNYTHCMAPGPPPFCDEPSSSQNRCTPSLRRRRNKSRCLEKATKCKDYPPGACPQDSGPKTRGSNWTSPCLRHLMAESSTTHKFSEMTRRT